MNTDTNSHGLCAADVAHLQPGTDATAEFTLLPPFSRSSYPSRTGPITARLVSAADGHLLLAGWVVRRPDGSPGGYLSAVLTPVVPRSIIEYRNRHGVSVSDAAQLAADKPYHVRLDIDGMVQYVYGPQLSPSEDDGDLYLETPSGATLRWTDGRPAVELAEILSYPIAAGILPPPVVTETELDIATYAFMRRVFSEAFVNGVDLTGSLVYRGYIKDILTDLGIETEITTEDQA